MAELEQVFRRYDTNGDGKISAEELASVLRALGAPPGPGEPGSAPSRRYRVVVAATLFQCAAAPGSHHLPAVAPPSLRRSRAPREHPSPVVPKPSASPPSHVSADRASSRHLCCSSSRLLRQRVSCAAPWMAELVLAPRRATVARTPASPPPL
ncbi:hypothetical protein E2562_029597 [Oryza meyeriana var. granulata]|uniref:EF-hand domain-containing protein n=1 Tax=Oryza meyeriana var. granulata TaxID=110450 RepID=A0A6G1E4Q6_9ORYZ|nr:hypothetical protein E2562_029597 [Oryza meyeriana var. granulata]